MGFSWSLLFCQHTVTQEAEQSLNDPSSTLLRDRRPPVVFQAQVGPRGVEVAGHAHYIYVDNLGVASGRRDTTEAGLDRAVAGLEGHGLLTHEKSVETVASPLGVCWNGDQLHTALTAKRFWRVTQAVRFALSRRAVLGWCWEIWVGHLTFCGLLVRDAL